MASFNTLISATTLLLIGFITLTSIASEGPTIGGYGPTKPADAEAQAIADSVRTQVEDQVYEGENQFGTQFPEYQAVKYAIQIVAGTNWCIMVRIGGGDHDYMEIVVFEPLPSANEPNELKGVQTGLTEDTPIPIQH